MTKRKIIRIDENKCNGCGACIPNCPEGALQMIDGKARLISDLFCDGLGACIGKCPESAISIEEREAEPYDEKKVMKNIVKQGENTIKAHLEHLKEHGAVKYLNEALEFLDEAGIDNPLDESGAKQEEDNMKSEHPAGHFERCPGARMMDFSDKKEGDNENTKRDITGKRPSQLRQWPVQMHLISPMAPYFQGSDVVLAADCTAYALGDFHKDILKGKSIGIACPKLDSDQDIYADKIKDMIDEGNINTLTVVTMEVPCCAGLLHIAKTGAGKAKRKIPIKSIVVGIKGNIIKEEWV